MNEVRILNKFCKKLKITESFFFIYKYTPFIQNKQANKKKKNLIYFDCACCVSVVLLLTFRNNAVMETVFML